MTDRTPGRGSDSFASLQAALAAARDERERAELLDSIGIRYARRNQLVEALDSCTQAVAILSRLAKDDSAIEARLAVALSNQGLHFFALERYEAAVVAHAHALMINGRLPQTSEDVVRRAAYNAERLGAVLSAVGRPALAARFEGLALEHNARLVEIDQDVYREPLQRIVHNIQLTLDASRARTRQDIDTERNDQLWSLSLGSGLAAKHLGDYAEYRHREGAIEEAIVSATRAAHYCRLLKGERPLTAIWARCLLNVALWSLPLGGTDAAAEAAEGAVALYRELALPYNYAEPLLARSEYCLGLLRGAQTPALSRAAFASAVEIYESLVKVDPAQFAPRLAESLHGLGLVLAGAQQPAEAAPLLARSLAIWTDVLQDPQRFDADLPEARERVRLLRRGWRAVNAEAMTASARIEALLDDSLARLDRPSPESGIGMGARGRAKGTRAEDARDRRYWSCTGRDLSFLMGDLLAQGLVSSDTHALARGLRAKQLYLARDDEYRCRARMPDLFITYDWAENFIDLQESIYGGLKYIQALIQHHRPHLSSDFVERLVFEEIGVWVDFVFIDQSARDLTGEVREVLPRIITAVDAHLVLSRTALLRSWCCYELALFNQRAAMDTDGLPMLRSFVRPSPDLRYKGFVSTRTTMPEDKAVIERYLLEQFPGGMDAMHALLTQASMLADVSITGGRFVQTDAAEQALVRAADRWVLRANEEAV